MERLNVFDEINRNKRNTWILIAAFIALLTLFGFAFDYFLRTSGSILLSVLIFSILWTLISYYASARAVLFINGAKPADPQKHRYLINVVEGLSIAAGIPAPKVYIIETPAMNAFATGRDPKHAYVAFTTGLIEKLDRQELEGVAAHEIAHIANYDIRIQTIAVLLAGFFVMVADIIGRMLYWNAWFGFGSDERRDSGPSNAVVMLIMFVISIIAAFFAELLKLAISRQREYLADATAVVYTRNPEGLASALEKIAGLTPPFERANAATAHLFIYPPHISRNKKARDYSGFLMRILSTHPPIEERINRLRSM
jgi:heat shock protein HtpX